VTKQNSDEVTWETVWAYGKSETYLINVLGPTEADIAAFIETRPEYIFFFGPHDLDQGLQLAHGVSLIATYRIAIPDMSQSGANPASMAASVQSGTTSQTGVGTANAMSYVPPGRDDGSMMGRW